MTLTEQWKKGELKSGWYYTRLKEGTFAEGIKPIEINFFYEFKKEFERHNDFVEEVLAEVPTYEEYQATENYIDYLKQCISVYEDKEKQHTKDSVAYMELAEENEKLKELLGEVLRHELSLKEVTELTRKISEALGDR